MQAAKDDIEPAKYAGEGWYATEEYANPNDVSSDHTRGEIGHEGEYYPGPKKRRKRR